MNGFQITFLVLKSSILGKSWRTKLSEPLTCCRNTAILLFGWTISRNRRQLLAVKSGSGSENGVASRQGPSRASKICFLLWRSKIFWKTATSLAFSIKASGDRRILAERLNISPQQLRYVDNSEPGEGFLIYESMILPFRNPIPQRSQRYKIMMIQLGEIDIDTR